MATYTDTGLGWYAYEDWVRQETGILGTLGGAGSFYRMPASTATSYSGRFGAFPVEPAMVIMYDRLIHAYVGIASEHPDGPNIYVFYVGNTGYVVSPEQTTDTTYVLNNGVWNYQATHNVSRSLSGYPGWYYRDWGAGSQEQYNSACVFDSIESAMSAVIDNETGSNDASFYKFLPGYCVACIAEWGVRGEAGSYIGPILASTESQYIALSTDNEEAYSGHVWYEDFPAPGERVYFQAIRDFSLPDYQHVIEDLTVPYVNLGIGEISDTQIALQILEKSGWHWGSYEDTDPYADGGESEAGGGDGTFDFSSTEIPYGGLPTIGAFATGMVDVYMPTRAELVSLSQYLWAGAFDVDNFKKVVADPMDVIIGLHIIPLTKAQVGVTSSTLVVGNISTGISMDRASKQYVLFDMGSIEILPKWGAYLDFSPYSKLTLFLPYIGYVDISPDDCMDGTIGVQYYIDIISGICVAQVKCNDHVLYQFSGNCSCQLPITAGQYQNIAIAGMNILGAALGSASSMIMPKGGGDTGDKLGAASGAVNLLGTMASEGLSMFKPSVQRSGGFGSSSGLMGIQTPYLILTVPRMCIPGEQNKYIGYPSFVTKVMSTLSGFNSVEVTHLNNMSCTAEEADEIIALLSQGVIF